MKVTQAVSASILFFRSALFDLPAKVSADCILKADILLNNFLQCMHGWNFTSEAYQIKDIKRKKSNFFNKSCFFE